MKRIIKVGTRESKLALVQTGMVVDSIKRIHPELEFEIIGMTTKGDEILDKALDKIGGKGLFIKELEQALLDGSVDMAVHSVKDMPAQFAKGLVLAAVSQREDPRDVLIGKGYSKLSDLPTGAVIGTSSSRREVQLKKLRPDIEAKLLRGNVITRLSKLEAGQYDAIVLAAAGLNRLGINPENSFAFDVEEMIPAVGQGILGIETREDFSIDFLLDSIHDKEAELVFRAERAFMIHLEGGCSTPIAAHAILKDDKLCIYGMYANEAKTDMVRGYIEGSLMQPEVLGIKLADELLNKWHGR